jgi:ankyrin repeat protein
VQLLINHGADVNAPQFVPSLPSALSIRSNDNAHRLPKRFIEKSLGSSSSSAAPAVAKTDATPLHFAAANDHLHIARLLLKCGARGDRVDKQGTIPDMLAAAGPHPETAALLRKWMHGQDADLHFRAESLGTSSNSGRAYSS